MTENNFDKPNAPLNLAKNYEFKAKVDALEPYEQLLESLNAQYIGIDHQIDTYFDAPVGRLKLREGNIENALIHYIRADIAGSKESQIILYPHTPDIALKHILMAQFGIKAIVDKRRKIYFINNVKFHLDIVESLGFFIEVEAIDRLGDIPINRLKEQCDHYLDLFRIQPMQLISKSYSDMIIS